MKKSIMIIDDELGICTSLSLALEDKYDVKFYLNPLEALNLLKTETFNICLLDLKIGSFSGLEILDAIKEIDKNIMVIIMTAYGSIDTTVKAIKKGAYTYLTKPLNINDLYFQIEQALEFQRLNETVEYLSKELENKYSYHNIIGRSSKMKKVFSMIEKVKDVDTNVLITGESGTGKELVARAIHYSSKRKKDRFAVVNCAAIPDTLLEEELFGHKKGAFTGAVTDRKGIFEYANNGTIFLDEISDLPFNLQAKLLRVLQEKEYSPIGSNEKRQLNIRVISATNNDLKKMVENGDYRLDLYYRLNVVEINLPPLRERRQDLPLLFKHFIEKFNNEFGKEIKGLSREAERILFDYNYPGNVRELSNIIEAAIVLSDNEIIQAKDLPTELRPSKKNVNADFITKENLVGLTLKEVEKRVIQASLEKNNWHRLKTSEELGISEKGLRNKIKEYNLHKR